MQIDPKFLNQLIASFERNRNKKKYLYEITKNPKRFIEHVKYYIEIRTQEYPDVYFSDDYSILYIN